MSKGEGEATKRRTVCVDLDGVLAKYDGWVAADVIGEPIEGAVEFVKWLLDRYEVVLYTARLSDEHRERDRNIALVAIYKWLSDNGLDDVEVWQWKGKPVASAYVDDRAVYCAPQRLNDDEDVGVLWQWTMTVVHEMVGRDDE